MDRIFSELEESIIPVIAIDDSEPGPLELPTSLPDFLMKRMSFQIPAFLKEIISILMCSFEKRGFGTFVIHHYRCSHCPRRGAQSFQQVILTPFASLDVCGVQDLFYNGTFPAGTMIGGNDFLLDGWQIIVSAIAVPNPNGNIDLYWHYEETRCDTCRKVMRIGRTGQDFQGFTQDPTAATQTFLRLKDDGPPRVLSTEAFRFHPDSWDPQVKNEEGQWKCVQAEMIIAPETGQCGHIKLSNKVQHRLDRAEERAQATGNRITSTVPFFKLPGN